MKIVQFVNTTSEDFSHKWDNDIYTFKAGESTKLKEPIALHFARHLAIRELNKIDGKKGLVTPQNLDPLVSSYIVDENEKMEDKKFDVLEESKEIGKADKKPLGRPKKVKEEVKEFEGLTE